MQNKADSKTRLDNILPSNIKTGALSKENCDCAKGIFSVLVLMHHLSQKISIFNGIKVLDYFFANIGHLAVSVFFFLSGYGLAVSFKKNKDKYIRNFPKHKILPFYCIEIFVILLYTLYKLLIAKNFSFEVFARSFLIGDTIIANGWYLQVQLMFYIFFYLSFRFIRSGSLRYVCLSASVFALSAALNCLGLGIWWYRSCPCFLLGFLGVECHEAADKTVISIRKWAGALAVSLTLLLSTMLFIKTVSIPFLNQLAVMLYDLFFVIFIVLFISRISISFSLTRWLGRHSLGIYVIHGMFLSLYHSNIVNIDNDLLYCLLVIISTLAASMLIQPVFKGIYALSGRS